MKTIGAMVTVLLALAAGAWAKDWQEDFDKAAAEAKASNRYLLVDFSGSDWCGWCMKLEDEVFSKKAFKDYAKDNLVLALADFPQQKAQSKKLKERNQALSKQYGVRGYPTVIVLSPSGELAGQTGYREGGPEAYVAFLKEMIDAHKAKAGPAAGPAAAGGAAPGAGATHRAPIAIPDRLKPRAAGGK